MNEIAGGDVNELQLLLLNWNFNQKCSSDSIDRFLEFEEIVNSVTNVDRLSIVQLIIKTKIVCKKALIKKIIASKLYQWPCNVYNQNDLHCAIASKNLAIYKMIFKNNPSLLQATDCDGNTCLHLAIIHLDDTNIIKQKRRIGSKCNLTTKFIYQIIKSDQNLLFMSNNNGLRPVNLAEQLEKTNIAEYLTTRMNKTRTVHRSIEEKQSCVRRQKKEEKRSKYLLASAKSFVSLLNFIYFIYFMPSVRNITNKNDKKA